MQDHIESSDSSVQIAAAITSYARIYLNQLKYQTKCVAYCDTDCLVLSKPVDPKLLGGDIGLLKNELADSSYTKAKDTSYYFLDGVFLAPKVYMLKYLEQGVVKYKVSFKGVVLNNNELDALFKDLKLRLYLQNITNPLTRQFSVLARKPTLEIFEEKRTVNITFDYNKRLKLFDKDGLWFSTKTLPVPLQHDLSKQPTVQLFFKHYETKVPKMVLPYPDKPFLQNFKTYTLKNVNVKGDVTLLKKFVEEHLQKPNYYQVVVSVCEELRSNKLSIHRTFLSMSYGSYTEAIDRITAKLTESNKDLWTLERELEQYWWYILKDNVDIHIRVLIDKGTNLENT